MGTTGSRSKIFLLFLIVASSLAGCGLQTRTVPAEPITLDPAGAVGAAVVFEEMDYSGLAAVLKAVVRRGGKVVADRLMEQSNALEGQLIQMSIAGPETTPKLFAADEQRLVYWYNARAAWALRLLMTFSKERFKDGGDVSRTAGVSVRRLFGSDEERKEPQIVSAGEFSARPFPLDGRTMTLADIDSLLEEKFGWKAVAAAPCVMSNRAALPVEPVETKKSGELLDKRFNEFVDDPDRFVIESLDSQILVPSVLWRFRDRILDDHKRTYRAAGATLTTALLPHTRLSAHRRLQDAIGYECAAGPQGSVELLEEFKEDKGN